MPADASSVAAAARSSVDESADSFRSDSGDDSSSFQFSSNSSNSARVLSFSDQSPIAQDKQSSTRRASGPQFRDPSASLSSPITATAESPLSPLLASVAAAQTSAKTQQQQFDEPAHSFSMGGAEHSAASLNSTTSSMVSTGWHAGSIEPVRMHGGTGGRLPLARQLVKEFPENGGSVSNPAPAGRADEGASISEDSVSRALFPPSTPVRDDASQHRHSASRSAHLSAPRPMASSQNQSQHGHTRSHTTRLMSLADSPRQEASYKMYAQFSHPSSHAGSASASVVGSVSSFVGHSPAPASMAASPFPVSSPQPSRIAFNGGRRRADPPSS